MKKYGRGRGTGEGGFEGKALYFRGGWGWRGCCFLCFSPQSSGQLAFVKMYNNFLQVMVLLKMQFVQMGSVGMKKKVPIFRRGLSRKKRVM